MKRFFQLLLFGLLIGIPLVLLFLPSDFFDHGKSICLSVLMLHKTCPGCGITRAIQHLIHLEFAEAAAFNKLSFVVLPALIFFWFRELRRSYRLVNRKAAGK